MKRRYLPVLLAVLLGGAMLVSAGPVYAVTEAECHLRHAVCVDACKGNKSCERPCDQRRRTCLRDAHQN